MARKPIVTPDLAHLIKDEPTKALAAIARDKRLLAWRSTPNGSNPLMVAAFAGHAAFVEAMLALGVDVNFARTDGFTALVFAAQNGHATLVKRMIAAGAALDHRSHTGESALSLAIALRKYPCAGLLIEAGAKLTGATPRGPLVDEILKTKEPYLLGLLHARGIDVGAVFAGALDDGDLELALALLDKGVGGDKGAKRLAVWVARYNLTDGRAALERRGIAVPASKGPPVGTLGFTEAKKLLTKLGLWTHAKPWFPKALHQRALVYREGLHLAKLRLDHTFAIDGAKGPRCGAGVIVIGDLVVDGTIQNGEQDFGPFLVVTGNLTAANIAIGGADVLVGGDLTVRGAFHGYYNHGHTHVLGATRAPLLIADDYSLRLDGKVTGTVIDHRGHIKSKHALPPSPPYSKVLLAAYRGRHDDDPTLSSGKIFSALVAGKQLSPR